MWLLRVILFAMLLVASAGCRDKSKDVPVQPAELVIREDTAGLMLTCLDDKGDLHVALKPSDVPKECRALVRVLLQDRDVAAPGEFMVVDLNAAGPDGAWTARPMKRSDWESEIEKRRKAAGVGPATRRLPIFAPRGFHLWSEISKKMPVRPVRCRKSCGRRANAAVEFR